MSLPPHRLNVASSTVDRSQTGWWKANSVTLAVGSGSLPASANSQNADGHMNSLSQLPMSNPLAGSTDAQYDMGPSSSSQHHSGSQAWGLNEAVQ